MTDPQPDEFERRRKASIRITGLILVGLVALIYFIAIARMGAASGG